ncbi:MAG: ethanolamine ammonia-lyase reactivating factor EutA [Oscillospiraceae bacterium]|nr:ethanolamine ammonia-lyase reactivating factor EutA [Oscillospiraceae bacterium]
MSERLLSVGLDVGTTSTQMILSELVIENHAGSFSVPQMKIAERKILYKSPVHFTPLLDDSHVDGEKLKQLVQQEYASAGIQRQQVDTGAVIITGETSRKENAEAVLTALSDFAGDFVVATAGPDLESVLAAKGSGAVEFSQETGKTVLHMDIGGGTSNLALIRDGKIVETGCLNVGGRLLKFDEKGNVIYVSPVLKDICPLRVGDIAQLTQVEEVAEILTQALEMAAGLRQRTQLVEQLTTEGTVMIVPDQQVVVSFSGGVADCIDAEKPWLMFGDMGPVLGQKIKESRLCSGEYRLGEETIRATVIGAGCHSAQLSGSTVFYRNVDFPMKNLPVMYLPAEALQMPQPELIECIRQKRRQQDTQGILFLPGRHNLPYSGIKELARSIAAGMEGQPLWVAAEQDMAKALGQALALQLHDGAQCLCIDGLKLAEGDYLDVGAPVGPAIPVVIKTLIFEK